MVVNLSSNQLGLDIVPLSKWNQHYEYPSVNAMRQWIFRDTNNFKTRVICIIGGKQYIRISAFKQWIEDTNK